MLRVLPSKSTVIPAIGVADLPPHVPLLSDALAAQRRVTVVADPDRVSGRGYYIGVCFKIYAGGGPDQSTRPRPPDVSRARASSRLASCVR